MPQASDKKKEFQLNKTIVLVGMMGSGKTAIGKALAARLDVPFLDSDAAIVEAAAVSISEIFERDGETFFRKREAEVIHRLLAGDPCILSTGGGAFLTDSVRDVIDANGAAIWLDASLDILWERVRNKDTRPLLRTDNPRQTLSDIYDVRVPIYRLAGIHVHVAEGASIDVTTESVVQILSESPEILEKRP